jgi:hypothetical protein
MNFWGLLVESYGTWLLLQRPVDASKDSDIPKNVPFAFAINNRNTYFSQPSRVRLPEPLRALKLRYVSWTCTHSGYDPAGR